MGVVYRAVHRDLKRPVAIKMLAAGLAANPSFRRRFLREAETLARLNSEHVVRVHDAGEEDGVLFIATELVPGGDLEQLLAAHGSCPPELAVDLLEQVGRGIAAAHRLGILHRDIKPSNVLVERRDDGTLRAVVCDFGIAWVEDASHTKTPGVIGTWGYLAPERLRGADATTASDVYALGCLLWALLTGSPPYVGAPGEIAVGHLQAPVRQLPPHAPGAAWLNPMLARAMAKSAGARPASVPQMLEELAPARLAAGRDLERPIPHGDPSTEPTQPHPAGPQPPIPTPPGPIPTVVTEPVRRPARWRRRAAIVATVVLLAGAVVGVVVAVGDDGGGDGDGDSDGQGNRAGAGSPTSVESGTATETGQFPDFKACLVADAGGFGDRSFNDAARRGLLAARDRASVETASVATDGIEADTAIADLVGDGCDQMATVGFLLTDAATDAARANPAVEFVQIDVGTPEPERLPNNKTLRFAVDQAAFLAGYLAASQSESGVVGTFGGHNIPPVTAYMEGFRQGVARFNADTGAGVTLLGWDGTDGVFTEDFGDPATGARAASQMVEEGADVVFPVSGPAGEGALRVAREAGIQAIWPDVDGYLSTTYGDVILTSVVKRIDVALRDTILDSARGDFTSTPYTGTLSNGGVGLAPFHDFDDEVPRETRSRLAQLERAIASGGLTTG